MDARNKVVLDKNELLQFDAYLKTLFEDVFYSLKDITPTNTSACNKRPLNGIVDYFIKTWTNISDYSGITKHIPTMLTGSIVEGAALSRLFHPDTENKLELEADIMYIVGCISERAAEQCLEVLQENPGYVRIKHTPLLNLFTGNVLPSVEDLVETTEDGCKYINGNKLKLMHMEFQPSNKEKFRCLEIQHLAYEVSIKQFVNGPSSEIIFTRKCICTSKELKHLSIFLLEAHNCLQLKISEHSKLIIKNQELQNTIHTDIEIFRDIKIRQSLDYAVAQSDKSIRNMALKITDFLNQHIKTSKEIDTSGKELYKYLRSLNKMLTTESFIRSTSDVGDNDSLYPLLASILQNYTTDVLYNDNTFDYIMMVCHVHPGIDEDLQITKRNSEPILEKLLEKSKEFSIDSSYMKELEVTENNISAAYLLYKYAENRYVNHLFQIPESVVSFDNVSCIRCSFWPTAAKGWLKRKRSWPNQGVINEIQSLGCYVVAKSGSSQHGDLNWRWSFSSAELRLAYERSPTMKYCYFLFKSLFYKHLKFEVNGKSLSSYIAKTCMMYVSETHDEYWLGHTAMYVKALFQYLLKGLDCKVISHYFIPEINLLSDIPDTIITRAVVEVKRLLEYPEELTQSILISPMLTKINDILSFTMETEQSLLSTNQKDNWFIKGKQKFKSMMDIMDRTMLNEVSDFRRSNLGLYYVNSSQIPVIKRNIIGQENHLARMRIDGKENTTPYTLIRGFLETNKRDIIQLTDKWETFRELFVDFLKEVVQVVSLYSKYCDVCKYKIICENVYYHCDNVNSCKYKMCVQCYQRIELQVDEIMTKTKKKICCKNQHPLIQTVECSLNCYTCVPTATKIDHDTLQMLGLKFLTEFSSKRQLYNAVKILGFTNSDMCHKVMNTGQIMKVLLEDFYPVTNSEDSKLNAMLNDIKLEETSTRLSVQAQVTHTKNVNQIAVDGINIETTDIETDDVNASKDKELKELVLEGKKIIESIKRNLEKRRKRFEIYNLIYTPS